MSVQKPKQSAVTVWGTVDLLASVGVEMEQYWGGKAMGVPLITRLDRILRDLPGPVAIATFPTPSVRYDYLQSRL